MNLQDLLQESTKWLGWSSIFLASLTIIAFVIGWGLKFRLFGATAFAVLLTGSSWAFSTSYSPPQVFAGAVYAPIVFDNGNDLIVAQVPSDFSEEAIEPTLDQLAENVKGRSRSGDIHIRLRKLESISNEISRPVIVGEVIKNLETNTTTLMEIDRGAE